MEIVFTDKLKGKFNTNEITGVYGDVTDLLYMDIDIDGIDYDDEWTVKRFLNGHHLKLNKRIEGIFNYLNLDIEILLDTKIKDLSKNDYKFILLAYILLINKNIIIFDYFDYGLIHKEKKRIIKIMKNLKKDGKTIIVISKDLVFLSSVVESIKVFDKHKLVYDGDIIELVKDHSDLVDLPEIIKFIELANKKGANLSYTLDSKELLKDVYRSAY